MTILSRGMLFSCGVLIAAFLLAGCGGSSAPSAKPATETTSSPPTPTRSATTQRGFLAIASNGALFIQWTRTGNTVTGTLSEVYTSLPDPTQAQSESAAFTGVVSGSSVTLTFNQGFGVSTNWNGTLDGSRLTLSYTDSDGSLQTFEFRPASVADYNAAVAKVEAAAGAARAQRAQAEAVARARQAIDADAAAVLSDLDTLRRAVASAKSVLASVPDLLARESADLATTKADLVKTLRLSGYDLCNQAYTTENDAFTVENDVYSVENVGYSLDNDLGSAKDAIASLQVDFDELTQDRAVLPSHRPQGAPTASEVSNAIASAQSAMAQIRRTFRGYVARAKAMLETANAYAARAQAACEKVGG